MDSPTAPTANGKPGGSYTLVGSSDTNISTITLLAGDLNGDDKINNTDLKTFRNNFGSNAAANCTFDCAG